MKYGVYGTLLSLFCEILFSIYLNEDFLTLKERSSGCIIILDLILTVKSFYSLLYVHSNFSVNIKYLFSYLKTKNILHTL